MLYAGAFLPLQQHFREVDGEWKLEDVIVSAAFQQERLIKEYKNIHQLLESSNWKII
ncbi:hypothetical protein PB1_09452 [Bacillus methanolicus PB1]|uniref:Uncharacterized protein n=1 Tax=Bacillus methanolicus PB1 TaxID=997296 RepID=I3E255_BACMT|nr:hypothetical protein PB1_09452 [Bacillus methanolicus PB1]